MSCSQGFKQRQKQFVLKYIRCYTKLLNAPKNSSLNDSYLYRMNALLLYNYKFQQECIPVGCVPSATVTVCWRGCLVRGGAWSQGECLVPGGLPPGGVPGPGGCLSWGGSAPWGGIPACTEADSPCEQNHRQVYLRNFVADGKNCQGQIQFVRQSEYDVLSIGQVGEYIDEHLNTIRNSGARYFAHQCTFAKLTNTLSKICT